MGENQRNSDPQPFIKFSFLQFVTIKGMTNQFKMLLNPEAHAKIFLQKRAVLESKFKKHLLKQPFFAKVSMN
jgi:hypothetical protein